MKKYLNISLLTLTTLLFAIQMSTTSCTKETLKEVIRKDTVTVIRRDTIYIKDTAISMQLLIANSWKLQEVRGVTGSAIEYYVRGGSNNTLNYDLEHITFNANKTGTYYDPSNLPSSFTWDFANADNTKIVYTVNFPMPGPTLITLENIVYKNGSLKCDQYWSQGNIHSHSQLIRIPMNVSLK